MKKLLICIIFIALFVWVGVAVAQSDIIHQARRASVQPVMYIPVMYAYFTDPLEEPEPITEGEIEKLIHERIEMAIEAEREYQAKSRYMSTLTVIDTYIEPRSKTYIPLGQLCPKNVKFPERVLVVYKTEKKEITAWDKKYENDVLIISELALVSPSQAQNILRGLSGAGYSVSKEEIDEEADIQLLWFDDGWDDTYPIVLDWSVTVAGQKTNLIKGYENGFLRTSPIPDKKRVRVRAGYLDLLPEFRPKSDKVLALESELENTDRDLEKARKTISDLKKKDEVKEKRNINNATLYDVRNGTVTLKYFWVKSAASGIFLGNMKTRNEMEGFNWGSKHFIKDKIQGVVLTNAHVVTGMLSYTVYVSEDKERMWLLFPAIPFIQYTRNTKGIGSPAQLLFIDGFPIYSYSVDTAVLVTTAIPGYENNKAPLGNSDNIKQGDPVIMVGNPASFQKFTTKGIIANTDYDLFNTDIGERILDAGISTEEYDWVKSSSLWFDCPIGIGGTSGSGVWALEGKEKGKVIAVHNMGLATPTSMTGNKSNEVDVDLLPSTSGKLKHELRNLSKSLFDDMPLDNARFGTKVDVFAKANPDFMDAIEKHHGYISVSGMNAGIPINLIKTYLQERGLNPSNFGWDGLTNDYWVQ